MLCTAKRVSPAHNTHGLTWAPPERLEASKLTVLEYGFPMDDQELERMDYCHAKYYALLDKKTYLAPIGDHPQRIVDIGCGTGQFPVPGIGPQGSRANHSRYLGH